MIAKTLTNNILGHKYKGTTSTTKQNSKHLKSLPKPGTKIQDLSHRSLMRFYF